MEINQKLKLFVVSILGAYETSTMTLFTRHDKASLKIIPYQLLAVDSDHAIIKAKRIFQKEYLNHIWVGCDATEIDEKIMVEIVKSMGYEKIENNE